MRELLRPIDIEGKVRADATRAQPETLRTVAAQGGDCVLAVKDNWKDLREDVETYLDDPARQGDFGSFRDVDKGHGRTETRIAHAPATSGG